MNEEPNNSDSIDLTDLSNFLRSRENDYPLDKYQLQVIEEVVFLCVNEAFNKDIKDLRKQLKKRFPKSTPLPISDWRKSEHVLRVIYLNTHKAYKKSIEELINKYKLLPSLYWQDSFFMLDSKIEHEMREAKDLYDGSISKTEARWQAVEQIFEDFDLKLLDSIVITNKPYATHDGYPFWCNPYFTRIDSDAKPLSIKIDKGPYMTRLEVGFPPYASLPEMQMLLKKNFKQIQEYREARLPVPARRDHRKDNLPKMIDAYLLDRQGKSKSQIALELDNKYGGNITFEAVGQLVKRIKNEANRFTLRKQET